MRQPSIPHRQAAGLVVTASEDATLRVWRLEDGVCLRTLAGQAGAGIRAVVDVGGGRVACGGHDCLLRVWDVLSGMQLQQTPAGAGAVNCIAALGRSSAAPQPEGRLPNQRWGDRVATGHLDTGDIRLWGLRSGGGRAAGLQEGVLQGHTGYVLCLAGVGGCGGGGGGGGFGFLLASASDDRSVRLWDVDAGTCTAALTGHRSYVSSLAHLGGGLLLSGSADGALRVWDAPSGACLATVENADGERYPIMSACPLPGGAAAGSARSAVQRWRWDSGARTLSPDGAALRLDGNWCEALVAVPPGPASAPQLLLAASANDPVLRVLVDSRSTPPSGRESAGAALRQQAALGGHAARIWAIAVLTCGS